MANGSRKQGRKRFKERRGFLEEKEIQGRGETEGRTGEEKREINRGFLFAPHPTGDERGFREGKREDALREEKLRRKEKA